MPRDFLSDDNQSSMEKPQGRDFLSEPQKESFVTSAALAIPRIGEDLIKGGYQFVKNIPKYYESSKTEVPGLLNVIGGNPLRALSQAGAGITELGHNVLNLPRGIAEYTSNRLNLVPKNLAEKVPYQKDISQDINQFFGKPEQPGEELIRGIGRNALNLVGTGKVVNALNPMNLTAKNIAKNVLSTVEKNKRHYSTYYNNLWKEADKKGFGDLSSIVNSIDIGTLRKYSPKKSIVGIEEFVKNPNLKNAHAAKSDLLRMNRDLGKLTTLRTAERQQLKAVTDAIGNIQENMFKNEKGILDKKMLNKYNKIQQGYAKEVVPYKIKAINAFRRNEISAKELVNKLSGGEFAAKVGKYHPAIKLRPKVLPIAGGLASYPILKQLYESIIGQNQNVE